MYLNSKKKKFIIASLFYKYKHKKSNYLFLSHSLRKAGRGCLTPSHQEMIGWLQHAQECLGSWHRTLRSGTLITCCVVVSMCQTPTLSECWGQGGMFWWIAASCRIAMGVRFCLGHILICVFHFLSFFFFSSLIFDLKLFVSVDHSHSLFPSPSSQCLAYLDPFFVFLLFTLSFFHLFRFSYFSLLL